MLYKNIVLLEGTIGDNFKYMKTKEGRVFATFSLYLNSFDDEYRDTTERKLYVRLRIMVFDIKLVRYLHDNGAKNGCRVSIFGRLNSYKIEHKGYTYDHINVIVRDIHIIKTNNNLIKQNDDENGK